MTMLRAEIPNETVDRLCEAPTQFPAHVLRALACEYRILRKEIEGRKRFGSKMAHAVSALQSALHRSEGRYHRILMRNEELCRMLGQEPDDPAGFEPPADDVWHTHTNPGPHDGCPGCGSAYDSATTDTEES